MPETTTEKVQETARNYMNEAEKIAQNAFSTGNNFVTTTSNFYFDSFDRLLNDSMDINNRAWRTVDDFMAIYRRYYTESAKGFQEYLNYVNKTFTTPPTPAK